MIIILFILGFSYMISRTYPVVRNQNDIHGFTSIVSAKTETLENNKIKDIEIVRLLLPSNTSK
jgi:hypothetical protein